MVYIQKLLYNMKLEKFKQSIVIFFLISLMDRCETLSLVINPLSI